MNNRTRFGSKSILKRRAYYILSVWKINADVERERKEWVTHINKDHSFRQYS